MDVGTGVSSGEDANFLSWFLNGKEEVVDEVKFKKPRKKTAEVNLIAAGLFYLLFIGVMVFLS